MLSNTATPRYYAEFRDLVIKGVIPVCKEISMQMNRVDDLITDPRYYYDPDPVEGFINFCEEEMTLTDGEPLQLLLSFKLWAECIYGWYYFETISVYIPKTSPYGKGDFYINKRVKRRLCLKLYLIVGRGAAKTLFDCCVEAYELNVNCKTTFQIASSPTIRQSDEILSPLQTAITRARGPLFKFLTKGSKNNTTGSEKNKPKLVITKQGAANRLTNSVLKVFPMSIEKVQGLRPYCSVIDEWLSCDIREDIVGAVEQGASKLDDYLILSSSSEGTIRDGCGDTIKMELLEILKGEYYAPHVFIWWYKLDDIKEINDPAMWMKANPNIGYTVKYKAYERDVERAEHNPEARNDIIAKRFGIPMEGYTYFFTYQETLCCKRMLYFDKMICSKGMDLSQGDDFCAFAFLFPLKDGSFGVKALCFITDLKFKKLPDALKLKYMEFIKEGSLIVLCSHPVLNMLEVYDYVDAHINEHQYIINSFGYDVYNSKDYIGLWELHNTSYGVEKVPQGAKTESVPLGELKALASKGALLFDQKITQFCMGNAITLEDTNGNRKLFKKRSQEKIDVVSAMMDAYIAYKLHIDEF